MIAPLRYARFNLLCSGSGATGGTSNLPGGVTLRTGGATPRAAYAREARRELHDVDNWACPVVPHFVAQISPFSVDSGAFSIVGRIRDESAVGLMGRYTGVGVRGTVEKKQEAGRRSDRWDVESSGGVTLRTGGARREQPMHAKLAASSTTWTTGLAPLGHEISPFSVDSGAFSIVGRIRDESAVGSQGEIYRGWGARNGREKAGSWTGGRSISQKGVQHEDFPGGHPSYSGATGGTSNLPGGVTCALVELRREQPMHAKLAASSTTWTTGLAPLGHISWPNFAVFGGFRRVFDRCRIRMSRPVGVSWGDIQGLGCAERSRKSRNWTVGGAVRQKGATRGLPRASPILVLLSRPSTLNFGVLMGSGALCCMIAPAEICRALTFYALQRQRQVGRRIFRGRNFAHWWSLRASSLCHCEARRELHDVDNWACPFWPHFVAPNFSPFSVDSGARFRSLAAIRDESGRGVYRRRYTRGWVCRDGPRKSRKLDGGGAVRKKGVQHEDLPSGSPILYARFNLLSSGSGERQVGRRIFRGGVTLRTWWSYAASSLCTAKLRRRLHDVDNWACPVLCHISWPKFRPVFGGFRRVSIVGRIRDESAVGSHGEIYRGWGAERSRKSRKLDGREEHVRKKGAATPRTSPGDMRALTFYALAAERTGGRVESSGGVTLRTGGATPRAAYAREARPRAPRRGQLGLPRVPHFVGPNFDPFFVRRGSHGEIYRGWALRGTVEKKQEAGRVGGAFRKKGCNTRTSQGVTHPSTTLAQARLNFGRSDRWDVESSGGRKLCATGGATPEQPMHCEARRELPRRGQLGLPRWPHFVAQISPFSVDSGAFSIVGRIRDESAVGLMGRYTGVGVCGTVEKKQEAGRVGGAVRKKGCQHEDFPRGVTHPSTTLAQARLTSSSDGIRCISAGSGADRWDVESSGGRNFAHWLELRASSLCTRSSPRAPRRGQLGLPRLGHISWPKFRRFRWIPARFRSLAAFVMSRPWGLMGRYTGVGVRGTVEKKREAGRVGGAVRKKGCNTRTSQGVTHPSTTLAQARLTSDGATGGTSNLPGGVTLRTGGATPRAAYAREARRELHDVDNWACPVGPHFVAQISPVFVGRGVSWGDIQGLGCRGTVEKKRKLDGSGGAFRKKGCNTRTSQGVTHPSTTLAQSTLNFGVLMGSGALVLRSDRWDVESSGGVTLRTGGATPRAAYAREARRELHDVDNWACPVGPHFVAQISLSVDSGAFSIVGRIRDESAVGSHGEIYRGWGARNGREKAGSWTVGGAVRKKGCNTRTSQGVTHPSTTLAQARLTSEVLMDPVH
ncbi:UNVERIFIED_CONTAM: hypothetical protein Sindi_2920300 [Sesamum indicum]